MALPMSSHQEHAVLFWDPVILGRDREWTEAQVLFKASIQISVSDSAHQNSPSAHISYILNRMVPECIGVEHVQDGVE